MEKEMKVNRCFDCRKLFEEKDLFIYVDENNASITKNSSQRCLDCYKKRYEK